MKNDENKINKKTLKKNIFFDNKLKELGLEKEYLRISNYINMRNAIKLVHIGGCCEEIEVMAKNFFRNSLKCPSCENIKSLNQKDRNNYFKKKLENEFNSEFKLLSNFNGVRSDIKLEHVLCNKIFTTRVDNFLMRKHKCPHCQDSNIKKMNKNITIKEKRQLYEKDLNFEYKILTKYFNSQDVIEVQHKKCGTIFKKGVRSLMGKKDKIHCPLCKLRYEEKKFLNKLTEKYNGSFEIAGKFKGLNKETEFLHTKCGNTFVSTPSRMITKTRKYCNSCSPKSLTLTSLKRKVYNYKNGEYILLEYMDDEKSIKVRHKKCSKAFTISVDLFFKRKCPCPKCVTANKALGLHKFQERLNHNLNGLFLASGNYVNMHTKIPIQCTECRELFFKTPNQALKLKKCPNCKAVKKIDYTR